MSTETANPKELQEWQERDEAYEECFAEATRGGIRFRLGQLFGKNRLPDLTDYARHLAEGNKLGALPMPGLSTFPQGLRALAMDDFEQRAAVGVYGHTWLTRTSVAKLYMDWLGGKTPLGPHEDLDEARQAPEPHTHLRLHTND